MDRHRNACIHGLTRLVLFTPAARKERLDAQEGDGTEARGPGGGFRADVHARIERMQIHPQRFPFVDRNVRRAAYRLDDGISGRVCCGTADLSACCARLE
jgi:hypothetical protein